MIPKNFWRLLAIGMAAFVACCVLSVPLAPELAILILLAFVGGHIIDRIDRGTDVRRLATGDGPYFHGRQADYSGGGVGGEQVGPGRFGNR
jgi:hypothetical protein